MLCLDFDDYFDNKEDLNGTPLVGLYYDKSINGIFSEECKTLNRINFKEMFQNLNCLKLGNFDNYFIIPIIPALPPTLGSLNIRYNISVRGLYPEELFNKFENLKELELIEDVLKLE